MPIAPEVTMGIALDHTEYNSLCMIESRIFNSERYRTDAIVTREFKYRCQVLYRLPLLMRDSIMAK